MEYCPISLLFSLPAVASDSTLTNVANWATIVGLPLTILAIVIARSAFNAQKEALEHQQVLGAWSLLAQKGTGDLGRKDALEFLHSKGKSLAGLDLSNAYLVGLKLNGADLTGCNFTGANLTDAEFVECNFTKATFDNTKCTLAKFISSILYNIAFVNNTLLEGVDFSKSDLRKSDLTGAMLKGCYQDTKWVTPKFDYTVMNNVKLPKCNIGKCLILLKTSYGGGFGYGKMRKKPSNDAHPIVADATVKCKYAKLPEMLCKVSNGGNGVVTEQCFVYHFQAITKNP